MSAPLNRQPVASRIKCLRKQFFFNWLRFKILDRLGAGADNSLQRMGPYQVRICRFGDFEYLFRHVFWKMEYFFDTTNPAPVILDCGSNIGISVLFFKTLYPAARITAFEPSPGAFACLRENVARNRLEHVTPHNLALAPKPGNLDLFVPPENPGHLCISGLEGRTPGGRALRVAADVLSRHVTGPVDLVKMDIEGYEAEVLAELEQADRLALISNFIVEYHHHLQPGVDCLSRILDLLERNEFGYHVTCPPKQPYQPGSFQDIMIYAYRRSAPAADVPKK